MKLKPEENLQVEVVRFLRLMCPEILFWHNANEQKLMSSLPLQRQFMMRKKMSMMGMMAGVPDLTLHFRVNDQPVVAYIELKAGKNKTTPTQVTMHKDLAAMGFMNFVCYTMDEVIAALKTMQAPMRKGMWGSVVLT